MGEHVRQFKSNLFCALRTDWTVERILKEVLMRKLLSPVLGIAICANIVVPALACLWDYDTLQMENQRFPEALELITGKFLRHSPEFYQWRIADRQKKLEREPQKLEYYDDLAVAYEKTGDHKKAIETILKKDKIKPDQYETSANLGTFYIFDGQLEKSVPCIEQAIAINPDAHFGREVYQKILVEYMLSKMKDGKLTLPLRSAEYEPEDVHGPGFLHS
jgi:tetratricopeptide (TPR) repeat protein